MSAKRKLTWKEAHGDVPYIPCGNAYCSEGNCADCETQMELQTDRKKEQGLTPVQMTIPEQRYLKETGS